MREKFDTMTGTGRAMTKTPDKEQMPPINLPRFVFGTMSPYLKFKIRQNLVHVASFWDRVVHKLQKRQKTNTSLVHKYYENGATLSQDYLS